MNRFSFAFVCLAVGAMALTGCGSSDSSDSTPPAAGAGNPADLVGTWSGTIGNGSTVTSIAVTVDSAGAITSISATPVVPSGVTATTAGVAGYPTFFSVAFNDGSEGGFMTDSTYSHAFFLSDSMERASLQKGASGPASSYALADMNGSWSGTFAEINSSFDLTAAGSALATISSGSFSGSNSAGVTFSGGFSCVAPSCINFGAMGGGFNDSTGASGSAEVYLSPDKLFAGSLACDGGIVAVDNCGYNMWVKQ